MHSVLDQLDHEDVRLHKPRFITLLLLVYEGTYTYSSPLVAMHLLDRSCIIARFFLKYRVPQQWHLSQVYA